LREYDFVQAACAEPKYANTLTHIMPNAVQPLIVQASLAWPAP
jgi:ABC-type dipeptide/oligopeptide/nickel transport system permease subunit